ncbi:MAG TPA: hypothetical protein VJJ75_03470 [Candidatus Nanoarchaeia archaeon]|nr:hypothetical protein [Candidatus Nanoarchaeia archaeon]
MVFDPAEVQQYHGKTFVLHSGARYSIDNEGKFHGRPSLEGLNITLLAGLLTGHTGAMIGCFYDDNIGRGKEHLDQIVKAHGVPIAPGLAFVACISTEDMKKTGRLGMYLRSDQLARIE